MSTSSLALTLLQVIQELDRAGAMFSVVSPAGGESEPFDQALWAWSTAGYPIPVPPPAPAALPAPKGRAKAKGPARRVGAALTLVATYVPRSGGGVLLSPAPDSDGLLIEGTDMREHIRILVPGIAPPAGPVLVELAPLRRALLAAGSWEPSVEGDSFHLGGWSCRVKPTTEFPAPPQAPEGTPAILRAGELLAALAAVAPAISSADNRVGLNGLYIEVIEEGGLRLVATDGSRLHTAGVAATGDVVGTPPGMLLPWEAVGRLIKVLRYAGDGHAELRYGTSPDSWSLVAGDVSVTGRLIDGAFPDYRQVLPTEPPRCTLAVDVVQLRAALARVRPVAACRGEEEKKKHIIRVVVGREGLVLDVRNRDGVTAEASVTCQIEGEGFTFGVNCVYLDQALTSLDVEGTATIELHDVLTPIILRGAAGRMAVVMPVRLG